MDRNSLFETGQKVWRSCVRQILDLKKKPSSSRSAWCSFEMMKKKCEHVFRFLDGSASYGICDQIFICSSMNRRSLRRNRSHENTPKMETGIRKTNHHVKYEPCPKLLSLSLELELWQFHKSMRARARNDEYNCTTIDRVNKIFLRRKPRATYYYQITNIEHSVPRNSLD